MFVKIGILLSAIVLTGCVSQEVKQRISNTSDSALCQWWMNTNRMNIHYKPLLSEIKDRGIDCNQYGDVAKSQRAAQQRLSNAFQRAANGGGKITNTNNLAPKAPIPIPPIPSAKAPQPPIPSPISPKLQSNRINSRLIHTQPAVGRVGCSYSDGSVVIIDGANSCPSKHPSSELPANRIIPLKDFKISIGKTYCRYADGSIFTISSGETCAFERP